MRLIAILTMVLIATPTSATRLWNQFHAGMNKDEVQQKLLIFKSDPLIRFYKNEYKNSIILRDFVIYKLLFSVHFVFDFENDKLSRIELSSDKTKVQSWVEDVYRAVLIRKYGKPDIIQNNYTEIREIWFHGKTDVIFEYPTPQFFDEDGDKFSITYSTEFAELENKM